MEQGAHGNPCTHTIATYRPSQGTASSLQEIVKSASNGREKSPKKNVKKVMKPGMGHDCYLKICVEVTVVMEHLGGEGRRREVRNL